MRLGSLALAASVCSAAVFAASLLGTGGEEDAAGPLHAFDYGRVPLAFEANRGQTDERVSFLARGQGYTLFLTRGEAVLRSRHGNVLRMRFANSSRTAAIKGLAKLSGTANYLTGGARLTGIPTYRSVRYEGLYRGVDAVFHDAGQGDAEYDLIVAPGADVAAVALELAGAKRLQPKGGDLLLHGGGETLTLRAPIAYQHVGGRRVPVESRYVLRGPRRVGFAVGPHDPARPLVIDPVLSYSTYLGGSGYDSATAIAVDSAGSAYVTGQTASVDFPVTPGAVGLDRADGFVTKLNASGTALVYSTYIGGIGHGIDVDASGHAYVTGYASLQLQTTPGSFQPALRGGFDAFVSKLNPQGSALVYSTYLGGGFDDFANGIDVDAAGNAYVTGWTKCAAPTCDFPTQNAFQPAYGGGNNDAFVTKLNPTGSALVYSTYLGGGRVLNNTDDWGQEIAVDSSGSAHVVGHTYSPDFPTTSGAFDRDWNGLDLFVTKLAPAGNTLAYSTFLGGTNHDEGWGIAVDGSHNAYVTGFTISSDFPTTAGAYKTSMLTGWEAVVTKLNAQGSGLVYSTYLGSDTASDRAWDIAVDGTGGVVVVGDTNAPDFPVLNAVQPNYGGGLQDSFVTRLNPQGSALAYSTFLGGSTFDQANSVAIDSAGDAYVAGGTTAPNFPVTPGAFQTQNGDPNRYNPDDAFVAKIRSEAPSPPPPSLLSLTVNPSSVPGGSTSQGTAILNAAAPAGGAVVTLDSSNAAAATVPTSVIVPAGSTQATFTITTKTVSSTTGATISGTYGATRSAVLTVTPVPTSDAVGVTRAEYTRSNKRLRVEATSTSATATLTVHVTSSGALVGTLTNRGGGRYGGQFTLTAYPQSITVRSSLGGSASRAVVVK